MAVLNLDEPAGVLVKTTCVDYPGLVAGSFFLKGCNLRCPYCYNKELIDFDNKNLPLNSVQDLFNHLEKRKGILKGIVISGGEPLLNPYTPIIIQKARSLGYKIKLDTNGTLPDELEYFINSPEIHPDFIAMDIKTSPERYADELCPKFSKFYGKKDFFRNVLSRSIKLIGRYSSDCYEFRTVLVPDLVKSEDIINISKLLPEQASWQFAQFRNENCLNPEFNKKTPYTDRELSELVETARLYIPGAALR